MSEKISEQEYLKRFLGGGGIERLHMKIYYH